MQGAAQGRTPTERLGLGHRAEGHSLPPHLPVTPAGLLRNNMGSQLNEPQAAAATGEGASRETQRQQDSRERGPGTKVCHCPPQLQQTVNTGSFLVGQTQNLTSHTQGPFTSVPVTDTSHPTLNKELQSAVRAESHSEPLPPQLLSSAQGR